MDNNETAKTTAEKMAIGLAMVKESFYQQKEALESQLTPEQKIEYEKLAQQHAIPTALKELEKQMEELLTRKM